jgi:dihydrofolate reductase
MRKITLFIHSTLNGVVTGNPDKDKTDFGRWARDRDALVEGSEHLLSLFDTADTILYGRATYEDLVRKWPRMQGAAGADDVISRLANKVNTSHKLVVTHLLTADDLAWGKFEAPEPVGGANVTRKIANLKRGEGGDIVIFGSPTLVRTLTDANLIDEYRIQVHPVVVHFGERLFDGVTKRRNLDLVEVTPLKAGGMLTTYRSA